MKTRSFLAVDPWACKRYLLALALLASLLAAANAGAQNALPADIQNVIRKEFDDDTRYLDGSADLNGDGKSEIVVHVIGQAACGTGGCTTMVFTPTSTGFRRVSTITVSNPPIRVSPTTTAGWKNLIVHVSGFGAESRDVELISDGKGYPGNPTVPGTRVKPATGASGDVLIKEFKSFYEAKPLSKGGRDARAPAVVPSKPAAPPASTSQTGPSFDCAKATTAVEELVCGDAALAVLDRSLADAYTKAMAGWPEDEKASQRTQQRAWIASRNACAKTADVNSCVDTSYRQRLTVVQIQGGDLTSPMPVGYVCKGHENEPFTVAFYNQTEPKSAVITLGDKQTIAFAAQSGSGARYTNAEIDFWEHQGEATVKWSGASFVCTARQ